MRFTKALVLDWETTGLIDEKQSERSYWSGPQGIEIGALVADIHRDWAVQDSFTSLIRFVGSNGGIQYGEDSTACLSWSDRAATIHGNTLEQLRSAPSPHQVAHQFVEFLKKNFREEPVLIAGHNPTLDRWFTMQLLALGGLLNEPGIRFHHRMLDSNTIGYFVFGATSSDELFRIVSGEVRTQHSAMDDARLCLEAFRAAVRKLGGIPTP